MVRITLHLPFSISLWTSRVLDPNCHTRRSNYSEVRNMVHDISSPTIPPLTPTFIQGYRWARTIQGKSTIAWIYAKLTLLSAVPRMHPFSSTHFVTCLHQHRHQCITGMPTVLSSFMISHKPHLLRRPAPGSGNFNVKQILP